MSIPYRKEIDGLRALAVLPVVLFHAKLGPFQGGFVGVDIFFVISGYLITSLILAQLANGSFSIVKFYEKRARRIFPALFFVMLVTYVAGFFTYLPGQFAEFAQSMVAALLFSSNIYFWKNSGYFESSAELNPLLHTWSLSVEEQFYVFIPFLLIVAHRKGLKWIAVWLIGLALGSFALNLWFIDAKALACFYLLPTRAWELLIGSITALVTIKLSQKVRQGVSVAGLTMICVAIFSFSAATPFPSAYALVPTIGAALIIFSAYDDTWVGRLLGKKAIVSVGLISYSFYLWHQPVFAFVRIWMGIDLSTLIKVGMLAVSLILAYATWWFIEKPFRDLNRFSANTIAKLSIMPVLILGGIGISAIISQGFLFRYAKEDQAIAGVKPTTQAGYVVRRFEKLLNQPFSNLQPGDRPPRKKILLIGDSFAQDVLNAVSEVGLDKDIEFSTRHVFAECGNLFIDQAIFREYIPLASRASCQKTNLFRDEMLRKKMDEADEIWFASSWIDWQPPLVEQSIVNLQKEFSKRLVFFGTKSFGDVDVRSLLEVNPAARIALRYSVNPIRLETNRRLEQSAKAVTFVDVQSILCGSSASTCTQVTAEGELKSHDGLHLTQAGARLLGLGLLEDGRFTRSANNRTTPE